MKASPVWKRWCSELAVRGLERLAKLYAMVERLHAMQERGAAGAVAEVEQAAARLREARRLERTQGCEALGRGSLIETLAAARSAPAAATQQKRLGQIKVQRKLHHEDVKSAHRLSRMERRQVDGVVEQARVQAQLAFDRQAQALSDDRFLARRVWLESQTPDKSE